MQAARDANYLKQVLFEARRDAAGTAMAPELKDHHGLVSTRLLVGGFGNHDSWN